MLVLTKYLTFHFIDISIRVHPISLTKNVGDSCQFQCVGQCSQPLQYQWFKDGVVIPGAEGVTLEIGVVTVESTGKYQCKVSCPYAKKERLSYIADLEVKGIPILSPFYKRKTTSFSTKTQSMCLSCHSLASCYSKWPSKSYCNRRVIKRFMSSFLYSVIDCLLVYWLNRFKNVTTTPIAYLVSFDCFRKLKKSSFYIWIHQNSIGHTC